MLFLYVVFQEVYLGDDSGPNVKFVQFLLSFTFKGQKSHIT